VYLWQVCYFLKEEEDEESYFFYNFAIK